MQIELSAGRPEPLGARWDGRGINFAVRSGVAMSVELCLFDPAEPQRELTRVPLPGHTEDVWHGRVEGLGVGSLYGFRVHGPWAPELGQRCNPARLLLDPYARAIVGEPVWNDSTRGVTSFVGEGVAPSELDARDSAPFVPRSLVVDERFDWQNDWPPNVSWSDSVIYELHVSGFSRQHPQVPEVLRGTYAGLAHPAAIAHFKQLGVTALELLPVHEFVDDAFLCARGLSNFWGYSTLGFFAPAQRYAQRRESAVSEFKQMVKALHAAQIEVLLDVVYNHTCEGDADGPCLSLKGCDHAGYYALDADGRSRDVTGCGNSLRTDGPIAGQLIFDSLRYWVEEMHVDGFRFDLATTLGRQGGGGYHRDAALWRRITEDPVLSRCKLIAEPWDLGPGGYRLGEFRAPLSEWNDKFRDAARRFWRGDANQTRELTKRLCGSPDFYAANARGPWASINFVTAHDGFTLHDLVSYEQKHNESNGEQNRDGSNHNESCNWGVEGETTDAEIVSLRERQKRNLLATLLLSQGVPMLLAGDELGRSQCGNNNAYCQDNEISWLSFELDARKSELLAFCRRLIALRKRLPILKEARFWLDEHGNASPGLTVCRPEGSEANDEGDEHALPAAFGLLFWPADTSEQSASLLLLFNASADASRFAVPARERQNAWQLALSTSDERAAPIELSEGQQYLVLPARSLAVFTREAPAS